MKQYLENLKSYLWGFSLLHTIDYKEGWNPVKFLPLYIFDYGTKVLTGGAVVTWSRWFYDNKDKQPARVLNRFLNWIDPGHGVNAGPPLWNTKDCSPKVRIAATVFWLIVFAAFAYYAYL